MKVLQFAFDGVKTVHIFRINMNITAWSIPEPMTMRQLRDGWKVFRDMTEIFVREYINCYEAPVNDCVWGLIRIALASVADLAVIPIQDYLCLGNEARMNAPATLGDNWRVETDQRTDFRHDSVPYERGYENLW